MRVWWLVVLTGCGSRYDRILALTGDPTNGEILYQADCASCHGVNGQGGGGGGSLVEALPMLTGGEILLAIDEGPDTMPAYRGEYTRQEMADLLDYMTLEFQ